MATGSPTNDTSPSASANGQLWSSFVPEFETRTMRRCRSTGARSARASTGAQPSLRSARSLALARDRLGGPGDDVLRRLIDLRQHRADRRGADRAHVEAELLRFGEEVGVLHGGIERRYQRRLAVGG